MIRMSEHSAPAPKRTKLFRACDTCVSSKTRCDDLTPQGCSLCRKKRKTCSLVEDGAATQHPYAGGSGLGNQLGPTTASTGIFGQGVVQDGGETRARLDMVEARTWDLELRVRQIEVGATGNNPMGSGPTPTTTTTLSSSGMIPLDSILNGSISYPSQVQSTPDDLGFFGQHAVAGPSRIIASQLDPIQERMDVIVGSTGGGGAGGREEEYDLRILDDMGSSQHWPWSENLFSLCGKKGYPDVVNRGLMSKAQVDMSFQLWKHRCAKVLPLAPFLLTSTPAPSHPFVQAAFLAHLEEHPAPALLEIINESIQYTMMGAVSVDVVLALLIGSAAGSHPKLPSVTRMISLAYELGQALGLESNTLAGLEMGDELCQPWWKERYEEMLLWEAVKCQFNLIHMSTCRIHTVLPSHLDRFPRPPGDNYKTAMAHLQREHTTVQVFQPYLEILAKAESQSLVGGTQISQVTDSWTSLQNRLTDFRKTSPPLAGDMSLTFIEFYVAYRAIKFFQQLPTPIAPKDKIEGHSMIGTEMLRISTLIVEYFIDLDLDSPACRNNSQIFGVVVGAIGTILAVYAVVYKQHPNFLGLNIERTKMAAEKVHRYGGIPSRTLRKMREEFAAALDVPDAPVGGGLIVGDGGGDNFHSRTGGEVLDPDVEAWTWLLASMPELGESLEASFNLGRG